jgi:transposase
LTISYEDGLLLLALRAKNNQTTLKLRDGMNNTAVFSKTVIRMVATGFLRQGDVLALDNAAIHRYRESTTLGDYLWYEHGILITFIPTRAPELNPIEQMWNILMQRLKNVALLGPGQNHSHQAATAAAMVMNECTHLDVQACYISSGYLSTF